MKKFSKSSTKDIAKNVMNVSAGAIATSLINKFVPEAKTKLIVKIAVGALAPMFIKNETVKTSGTVVLGNALVEVIDTYVMPKIAGLGLLPSQNAVGEVNNWIAKHTKAVNSVADSEAELPTQQTVSI